MQESGVPTPGPAVAAGTRSPPGDETARKRRLPLADIRKIRKASALL